MVRDVLLRLLTLRSGQRPRLESGDEHTLLTSLRRWLPYGWRRVLQSGLLTR